MGFAEDRGFQFDYVFDWTILKYQQSQLANPPSRALGANVGTSFGMPPAATNVSRQSGGDDGRLTGWSSANATRGRSSGLPFISGSLSKQKNPVADEAPTIAAAAYLRMAGRPPVLPSNNLSHSENFLYKLNSLYDMLDSFL